MNISFSLLAFFIQLNSRVKTGLTFTELALTILQTIIIGAKATGSRNAIAGLLIKFLVPLL